MTLNKYISAMALIALTGAAPAAWADTKGSIAFSAWSITNARWFIERGGPQLKHCEEAVQTGETLPTDFKPVYKAPPGLEPDPELLSMSLKDIDDLHAQTLHEKATIRTSLLKCLRKYKKQHGEFPWE